MLSNLVLMENISGHVVVTQVIMLSNYNFDKYFAEILKNNEKLKF